MNADLEALAGIIELLDQTEFSQFSFEQGDLRIAVSRGGAPLPCFDRGAAEEKPSVTVPDSQVVQSSKAASAAPAHRVPIAADAVEPFDESALAVDEFLVRSPLLGTFYRASKPGAPAFVEPGAEVSADSTLCIVEVMKLMNSVPAGQSGRVTRVLVGDGELVEFDQPLFVLKATA